jgi:hypothetical protein
MGEFINGSKARRALLRITPDTIRGLKESLVINP